MSEVVPDIRWRDPIAHDAVWKHLVDLRANYGTTLFFTTHYLEEAQSYCDRIAIMHLGKLDACSSSAPGCIPAWPRNVVAPNRDR